VFPFAISRTCASLLAFAPVPVVTWVQARKQGGAGKMGLLDLAGFGRWV